MRNCDLDAIKSKFCTPMFLAYLEWWNKHKNDIVKHGVEGSAWSLWQAAYSAGEKGKGSKP